MSQGFPVVGVGSSAGGISALLSLFKAMPSKTGLAFVVVPHLSPAHVSRLVWLLRDATELAVQEAVDGTLVERDHVYVIAPGQMLTISEGRLISAPRQQPMDCGLDTIDRFFESLAVDQGPDAVGVVLSGTGSDGSAGAMQIKLAGGKVFVQDPATAPYDSMPRVALATGAIDAALEIDVLARRLCAHASGGGATTAGDAQWKERTRQALDAVRQLVRERAGMDLGGYKSTPLLWRIRRRMDFRRIGSLPAYAEFIAGNAGELEALVRGLPIHVTSFFRDPEVWKCLAETVIAPLLASRTGPPIRAWTAACSSGEEAYSLAILLSEQASLLERPPAFQVFASDASADIVARAGRGWFPESAIEVLSPERRARFFEPVEGGYRVNKELRSKLVFARHDLLVDPPFSNLDLLTCRNLLIYMEAPAQKQVLALASSALRTGGGLVLGSGESLDTVRHGFSNESQQNRIYRKVDADSAPAAHLLAPAAAGLVSERAHLALLVAREQAAVLVDAELSILHVYGDIDEFLRVPSGELASDLPRLARPGLAGHVSFAVQQALDRREPVTMRRLWGSPRGAVPLATRVTPMEVEGRLRLLISFATEPGTWAETSSGERRAEGSTTLDALSQSDERLRLTTEELHAAHEELHAVNEELRSVNDQLNIVNDRLATSNEQLETANERLRSKIEELETQGRVLSSGAVMTLFLDEQLCVGWFTPAIRAVFPLVPSDVGRPITDVVMRVADPGFLEQVRSVIASGETREDEVKSHSGRWYLRRIGVHRHGAPHPSGVVVTFYGRQQAPRGRAEGVAG